MSEREEREASPARVVAREHHLEVTRTARYCTLGEPGDAVREVWFVCHGYGQLARYFVRHFAPLADGTRLVVAPEALSRFYLAESAGDHAAARVGASWMTREDREAEMSDYIACLDAVHDRVFEELERESVRVTVLGFSQGVPTASRWVEHGRVRADRLVAWAGTLPADVLTAPASPLRRVPITSVVGGSDPLADGGAVAAQRERLADHAAGHRELTFEGGHTLHGPTLLAIAGA